MSKKKTTSWKLQGLLFESFGNIYIVFSLSCVKYFKGTSFRDRRIRENRTSGGDTELGIGDSPIRPGAHQQL